MHTVPVVLLHTPGRVDNEDDVLAVDGNACDGIVIRPLVIRLQTSHLLRQALFCRSQRSLVYRRVRLFLRRVVLTLHRVELLLRAGELDLGIGSLLAHVLELPVQYRRLAADVE